jgi:hypothetical protein
MATRIACPLLGSDESHDGKPSIRTAASSFAVQKMKRPTKGGAVAVAAVALLPLLLPVKYDAIAEDLPRSRGDPERARQHWLAARCIPAGRTEQYAVASLIPSFRALVAYPPPFRSSRCRLGISPCFQDGARADGANAKAKIAVSSCCWPPSRERGTSVKVVGREPDIRAKCRDRR